MTLNPLSNPKGVKLLCELCQKPAFVQCTDCRVTYYCGQEHQKADWLGIHEKICQLLIPLRTPVPFLSSDEERQHREHQLLLRQRQMIDLTRTNGQKLLFEGKHEQAVPAAMQSLRFAIDVHGLASIELVPSYLILGEASIGLDRLSQAEEYLMQAQWTVLKTPECSNAIKSKLYRNLGLLYAAKGEYEEALLNLANDIYHSSEDFGTADIRTSGGYFHMANVFFRQNKMDIGDSHYEQVTQIWSDHLKHLVDLRTKAPDAPKGFGPLAEDNEDEEGLDEAQEAEAVQVLESIYEMREQQGDDAPASNVAIAYALAMLHYVLRENNKAREFCQKALRATEKVEENEEMKRSINELLTCVNRPV